MRWHKNLVVEKDPSDVKDYTLDFGPLLQSDTISTATVTGTNITVDSSSVSGNVVTVWLSGGTAGTTADVKTTIVTSNATPRTFERTFRVEVKQL